MNDIARKQIAERIEKNCEADLQTIEGVGIPRQHVISALVMAAQRELDWFSPETFRDWGMNTKEAARSQDVQSKKLRGLGFVRLSEISGAHAGTLRQYNKQLGELLRKHGRQDHDQALSILVYSILNYRPEFDCWEALERLIAAAYDAAGREAETVTADKLLRAAKPYRAR